MHRWACGSRASPTLRHRIAPLTAAMRTAACRENSHAPAQVPLRVPPTRTSRITRKAEAGHHRINPAAARFAMIPSPSVELQIGGRRLAAFHHNIVAHLLAIIQALKPSRLHRCDVDEHVLAAFLRHDEAEALGRVEPLDCTDSHRLRYSPSIASCNGARHWVDNQPFGAS